MTTTNFPGGVTSFGIPLYGGGAKIASSGPGPSNQTGRTWFVNAAVNDDGVPYGGDGNSGTGPGDAFATMDRAFDTLQSGDVINFCGKINEQLTTPANVFDVWINGMGNRPRHADSTPFGGNLAAAQWGASGLTAATANLRVIQQGWRFSNFLWTPVDTNAACVEVCRNAAAADAERDGSHASFYGVRFSGAGVGIRCGVAGVYTEIPYNVEVAGCQFDNMTYGMRGVIQGNQWYIHDNWFITNTNHIALQAISHNIRDNVFGTFTTLSISLAGGTGTNFVTRNSLSGTYAAPQYAVGGAGDNWYGNWASTSPTVNDPA